ncbi:MAG: Gfo/Idh/MocA family oxidoreductase, partial [Oscillospiraceae bacterium]|nr:Gfo/Idh/MocA family oxidoreductase [Oscillospiraceae bacterium]
HENLLECIAHGKPALCEKSLALTEREARDVFDKAHEKGVFMMEAMWRRFMPHIRAAREWVRTGAIGRVDMTSCTIGFRGTLDPEDRIYNMALAGGALFDVGVYAIEIMTYLIGEPVRDVKAMLSFVDTGADNVDNITLRFDRCVANLQCITTCKATESLIIYGTRGRVELDAPVGGRTARRFDADNNLAEEVADGTPDGFIYQIEETIRCVRAGLLESPVVPHKDTIECTSIFDRCFAQNAAEREKAAPLKP